MQDNGNYLVWGGGLLVITLVATGLAMLSEASTKRTRARHELDRAIAENTDQIAILQEQVDLARSKWLPVSGRKNLDGACERLRIETAAGKERIAELAEKKDELFPRIAELELAFSGYRSAYRGNLWQGAAGEVIGTLRTVDGKEYQEAVIRKVSAEGMEIVHSDGVARIPRDRLAGSWQQRFQWEPVGALSEAK